MGKKIHGWPAILSILISFLGWLFGSEIVGYLPVWFQDEKFHGLVLMILTLIAGYSKKPSLVEHKEDEPERQFTP